MTGGSEPASWTPYIAAGIGSAAFAMWYGLGPAPSAAVGLLVGGGGGYFAASTLTPPIAYGIGAGGAAVFAGRQMHWAQQMQIIAGALAGGAVYAWQAGDFGGNSQ